MISTKNVIVALFLSVILTFILVKSFAPIYTFLSSDAGIGQSVASTTAGALVSDPHADFGGLPSTDFPVGVVALEKTKDDVKLLPAFLFLSFHLFGFQFNAVKARVALVPLAQLQHLEEVPLFVWNCIYRI